MSDLVCLQCGKEMEYDWAPCPHCGWKALEPWDTQDSEEEGANPTQPGFLAKPNRWIWWIACLLLALTVAGLVGHAIRH